MVYIIESVVVETTQDIIDYIIPISTIFISIIALIVSIYALFIQREHNRKSVRPAGHVQLNDPVDGLFIKIGNKGCGPMFIKSLKVKDSNNKKEKNIYYYLPELKLTNFSYKYHTEPAGYWLTPGETLTLLKLHGNTNDLQFMNFKREVRNILNNLNISLIYTDVYDQEHPEYIKKLDWFSRVL